MSDLSFAAEDVSRSSAWATRNVFKSSSLTTRAWSAKGIQEEEPKLRPRLGFFDRPAGGGVISTWDEKEILSPSFS